MFYFYIYESIDFFSRQILENQYEEDKVEVSERNNSERVPASVSWSIDRESNDEKGVADIHSTSTQKVDKNRSSWREFSTENRIAYTWTKK